MEQNFLKSILDRFYLLVSYSFTGTIQTQVISLKTTQSQTSRNPHAKKTILLLTRCALILTNKQNITGLTKFFKKYKLTEIKNCSKGFYHISDLLAQ